MSIYQSKVNWRVAWLKEEEAARKKAAEAIEKERISYASVSVKKILSKNKHISRNDKISYPFCISSSWSRKVFLFNHE